jgi:hypothetical protein
MLISVSGIASFRFRLLFENSVERFKWTSSTRLTIIARNREFLEERGEENQCEAAV